MPTTTSHLSLAYFTTSTTLVPFTCADRKSGPLLSSRLISSATRIGRLFIRHASTTGDCLHPSAAIAPHTIILLKQTP